MHRGKVIYSITSYRRASSVGGSRHLSSLAASSSALLHGRVMMNSVNEPGTVSTSIPPPCCLIMKSWVRGGQGQAEPCPFPVSLVVRKGLNIFSFTSGGMPVPLSRIRISTVSPRSLVVARGPPKVVEGLQRVHLLQN
jgi:hypothetical protein